MSQDNLTARRPGRPKALEEKRAVSAWMPAHEHDRLIQLANEREQSVSKTLIEIVRQQLR